MTEAEFRRLAAAGYNRIPVVAEASADLYTPLAVYVAARRRPYSYLLESVVGGERFGRYSFIGLACAERIEAARRATSAAPAARRARHRRLPRDSSTGDPFEYVRAWLARQRVAPVPAALRFGGGLVGLLRLRGGAPHRDKGARRSEKPDPLGTPDMLLLVSDELAVVDNVLGKLYLVVYADPQQPDALRAAKERLERLRARLARPLPQETVLEATSPTRSRAASSSAPSPKPQFLEAVRRCKEYILAGDVHAGADLAAQLAAASPRPPLSLYRSLRGVNPSPYMFYFDFGDHHVVGASPEILVRLSGGTVTLRPIAGTRPRGATPEEDAARAQELLADPKERAEHVMLIDLGRNDVGRVAQAGSVQRHRAHGDRALLARHAHRLQRRGRSAPTASTRSTCSRRPFPAGTVTGAPKVRAMQIIDELEPVKRGVYSGAVGYLGFNGDMDVAHRASAPRWSRTAGCTCRPAAGIVADSDPRSEWEETQHKARAILKAAARCVMIAVIDNYDSFTCNLVQYLWRAGRRGRGVPQRRDFRRRSSRRSQPSHVVLSPGPVHAERGGHHARSRSTRLAGKVPILGVCLGHQAIGQAFGGKVVRARQVMHGKTSRIRHDEKGVFEEIPDDFVATRYHSLVVERASLPECLSITARVRGRRDHGPAPPQPAGRGRAVPSRGAAHRARAQNAGEFHQGRNEP